MYLALTYDHRLVDGREAVFFCCEWEGSWSQCVFFFFKEGVGGKSDAMYCFLKTDEITLICLVVFILMILLDSRCLVFSYI